ncbi:hypothetical protein ZIOFF_016016 [Zingiber officinale]|uniref:Reverse transcriptase Ty1/copia-type domain-containing protein n=1 Tax=Zingiber officinale TaxID=94328 RepID=A0A8J5HDS2_ZINOF|nr:hypothetical protein ZIOFF_016016 [Zingiber officinale]
MFGEPGSLIGLVLLLVAFCGTDVESVALLKSKEYWTVVISGVAESIEGVALTDAQLKDLKAKNYLFQAIDRSILETILCKNTAKDIWDSMKKKYQECYTNLKRQNGDQTNFAEEEEVSLLMVCHEKEKTQRHVWYLDTDCSNHMSGEKDTFYDLDETFRSSVKFGDNSTISVMGKGKLQEKGYEIAIKEGVCRIQDAKLGLIAQVNMTANHLDDNEKVQQPMEDEHHEEVSQNIPITDQSPMEAESQRSQHVRRRPAWMSNYEVTGIDQGDDPLTHFALFSDCDPTTFESAVKDAKWHDLIFTGTDDFLFQEFKKSMMVEFEMSDLGMMHYFLGMEVVQSTKGIFISQKKYVQEILDRFQMKDCNPVSTPTEFGLKLNKDHEGKKVDSTIYKQIVGSLMYLTATRPDIMYSVSLISRYMENPTEIHLLAAKRILRYLQGTKDFGLFYKKAINQSMSASLAAMGDLPCLLPAINAPLESSSIAFLHDFTFATDEVVRAM